MALSLFSIQSSLGNSRKSSYYIIILHSRRGRTRRFSEWTRPEEFEGENAYDILGVAESSTFAEIKASFLKLAKQTHPDLASSTTDSSSPHQRFIQILAAYEILSDSVKRTHYDKYLLSQRKLMQNQRHLRQGSTLYVYRSRMTAGKHMEVVEWLKWYRMAINDIVSEKKVAVGTGYFDVLEADFYSAIRMAYYGPEIESLDLLPDCFEAEERSFYETPEVLHLVSGRDLFGMVSLVNEIPEISSSCSKKLEYCASSTLEISQSNVNASISISSNILDNGIPTMHAGNNASQTADAYKDLELHVSGRVVAFATRVPPKKRQDRLQNEDDEDQIHVFLCSDRYSTTACQTFSEDSLSNAAVGSRIPLGTIKGLRTRPEEGSCFVYDSSGAKTHVIMKHRTLLVKHMHWYGVGDKVSVCECRCSRAQLPPSKFWLFEPRCGMHDIGGWYVETFGSDKKGRTIPSQRVWDGLDRSEQCDKRLHPAMYLLALAYRTLDLEDARRSKRTIRHIVEGQLFRVLHWCKKLV